MRNKITNTTNKLIEQESKLLGSDINYKLKQARLKALKKSNGMPNIFFRAWFTPITAAATLALFSLMSVLEVEDSTMEEQIEVVVDVNDVELLEQLELVENLEFYEWLSKEENISSI